MVDHDKFPLGERIAEGYSIILRIAGPVKDRPSLEVVNRLERELRDEFKVRDTLDVNTMEDVGMFYIDYRTNLQLISDWDMERVSEISEMYGPFTEEPNIIAMVEHWYNSSSKFRSDKFDDIEWSIKKKGMENQGRVSSQDFGDYVEDVGDITEDG